MSTLRVIEVPDPRTGERLDAFVAEALDVTRGYARRLLARGRVALRDRPARKGTLLRRGDRIDVGEFRHPREGILGAPELELCVLQAADGLIAIDKPAGLPTHPLDFDERRTASNAFVARHPESAQVGVGGLEPGLVHRLDTDTSGVLLFATRQDAWEQARRAFTEGRAQKRYLARVHGTLRGSRELRLALEHRGQRMRVVSHGGQATHTILRALESGPSTSLIEVDLRTGARHQIRASLAHIGFPVVGDRLYGSDTDLGRHLLHAWSLRVGAFSAQAPPPDELRE